MTIEKLISFHIERQFPAIYREEGQELIQFVKEYYKFLETNENQSLYNGRRLYEYRDIDTTLERMLLFFKNKYLADLPFDDQTVRIVVKNILGLYRRKGTQDGLELFFRLFYNEDIKVYYPSRDMLRPSDSEWNNGTYIEMIPNDGLFTSPRTETVYTYNDIVGRTIIGEASRARAVVDKINFIILNKSIIPVVFINAISSSFIQSEGIICEFDGVPINFGIIKGSLSTVDVDTTFKEATLGNQVGDVVTLQTEQGIGGKGIVTEVSETFTGIVSYEVVDGGFGYSIDTTRLLVSNQIVFISEDQAVPFSLVQNEAVSDQLGNTGNLIGNTDFAIGVKASANNEFTANSIIESSASRTPIESFKFANEDVYDMIYTLPEAILRAAIGLEPEASRFNAIISGSRKLGDINNDGSVTANDGLLLLQYLNGTLENEAAISFIENDFNTYLENNTGTYGNYPATKFKIVSVVEKNDSSPGDLYPDTANTGDVIVSEIENAETVSLIFDVIGDYVNVQLNSSNYNTVPPAAQPMSGNTDPVTINTPLDEAFDLTPFQIGSIVGFNNINPGVDYVNDVFAIAEDSRMIPFFRGNQLVTLVDIPATLNVGDEVTQNSIKGKVLAIQDKTITLRPYTYYGFNRTDPIIYGGEEWPIFAISLDFSTNILGKNATIDATTDFGVGKIRAIDVVDSGYGYVDLAEVSLIKENGTLAAKGTINVEGQGTTGGFWSSLDSHLNGYRNVNGSLEYFDGGKRIQDSDFYQEYSYEIQSKLDISTYEPSLKEITHVAGTKVFGKFNLEEELSTPVTSQIEIDS